MSANEHNDDKISSNHSGRFKAMFQLCWTYKILILRRLRDKSVHVCKYGTKRRQTMDIYLPQQHTNKQKHPCFIVSVGSGWIFGHKFFGIPFGFIGQKLGYITAVIDYPRYPFSDINQQIDDCTKAIDWIFANIEDKFNGDTSNVNIATYLQLDIL